MKAVEEKESFGFTQNSVADQVKVPVTFSHLYRDEKGNPITFNFVLRMETGEDVEALQSRFAGRNVSQHERRVARAAELITEMPKEFADFKGNGNMSKSVGDYLSSPKFDHIVRGLLNAYDRMVMPDELFR